MSHEMDRYVGAHAKTVALPLRPTMVSQHSVFLLSDKIPEMDFQFLYRFGEVVSYSFFGKFQIARDLDDGNSFDLVKNEYFFRLI